MRRSDAAAHREQGRAHARAAATAAARWAADADAWLRALPTDDHLLDVARRAVLATSLVRDLLDPDNGGGVSLISDFDIDRLLQED